MSFVDNKNAGGKEIADRMESVYLSLLFSKGLALF